MSHEPVETRPLETMRSAAPDTFRLIACPTLSHESRSDTYVHAGASVGEALRGLGWTTDGLSARVFIDGRLIPDAEWEQAVPAAGQAVVVRRVMGTGGGGNTGKQIGMLVGMMALMVGTFFIGGGGLAPLFAEGIQMGMGAALGGGGVAWQYLSGAVLVSGMLGLHGRVPTPLPRRLEAR